MYICGVIPRHLWSIAGIFLPPPSAAIPVDPRTYSKKKTVCVLGMGYGCLASALELHLRQVGEREDACRARVLPIPPNGPSTREHTPVWPFPKNIHTPVLVRQAYRTWHTRPGVSYKGQHRVGTAVRVARGEVSFCVALGRTYCQYSGQGLVKVGCYSLGWTYL